MPLLAFIKYRCGPFTSFLFHASSIVKHRAHKDRTTMSMTGSLTQRHIHPPPRVAGRRSRDTRVRAAHTHPMPHIRDPVAAPCNQLERARGAWQSHRVPSGSAAAGLHTQQRTRLGEPQSSATVRSRRHPPPSSAAVICRWVATGGGRWGVGGEVLAHAPAATASRSAPPAASSATSVSALRAHCARHAAHFFCSSAIRNAIGSAGLEAASALTAALSLAVTPWACR